MSSLTRKKLEARVYEAATTLGEALDDLRAYQDATRLVWHSIDADEFASRLSESTLENLVGDQEAMLHDLTLRCDELRAALLQSGINGER